MLRLGLDFSNDFITRFNKRTNEIITNVYDDVDINSILPNWSDSPEKKSIPIESKTEKRKNYPLYFNNKSILINPVYTDYTYPSYTIYKY